MSQSRRQRPLLFTIQFPKFAIFGSTEKNVILSTFERPNKNAVEMKNWGVADQFGLMHASYT